MYWDHVFVRGRLGPAMLAGQLLGQDCLNRPLLGPRAMTSWGHLVVGHYIPPMFQKKTNVQG